MPFSEAVKLEAKRRSAFLCAACRRPFVEVHHIIPQAEGGPDDLDNACPLCAYCHDQVGGNPEKRKQLREMRDLQWELNAKQAQHPATVEFNQKLDNIQLHLSDSAKGQAEQQQALIDIKNLMISHNNTSNVAISQVRSFADLTAVTGVCIRPPDKNEG